MGENFSSCPCTNSVSCWILEGRLGYCSSTGHSPGDGVFQSTIRYLQRGDAFESLKVDPPESTILAAIKYNAYDKLVSDIHSNIRNLGAYRDISPYNGILYCYRNHRDSLPPSYRLNQRPLKCGKASCSNFPARYYTQKSKYEQKGETISIVTCQRFPFIEPLDSYMKARLQWYKLPSRGGDGGTEWYYLCRKLWIYGGMEGRMRWILQSEQV